MISIMDNDKFRAELQAEYLHLQKVIEDFDGRALTIKAWSVTFSLVAIGGAFVSKAGAVFLVSCASALLFWFIEGSWKNFQFSYYGRSGQIEEHFRGERKLESVFQIGTAWSESWHQNGRKQLGRILLWPHVALPHVVVAALGLLFFVLTSIGLLEL
jgi:hypothetical protein